MEFKKDRRYKFDQSEVFFEVLNIEHLLNNVIELEVLWYKLNGLCLAKDNLKLDLKTFRTVGWSEHGI